MADSRHPRSRRDRTVDNAVLRLRAALLDLTSAGRHAEAAELSALIARLEGRPDQAPGANQDAGGIPVGPWSDR